VQQRLDLSPGLISEHVAADHATSHIRELTATRTYQQESSDRLTGHR
jgi:hypothetical protein